MIYLWRIYYFFFRPKDFTKFLLRVQRTVKPHNYNKVPLIYYNKDGRQTEIYLTNDAYYIKEEKVKIQIHRCQETNKIVGYTIYDKVK